MLRVSKPFLASTLLLGLLACDGQMLDALRAADAGPGVASDTSDAGFIAQSDGGADGGTATAGEVTVLTINLWHDFPNFSNLEARTEIVARFIKARKPDLVALQEAGQGTLVKNRCEVLAQKTGYFCSWVSEGGVSAVFSEGPGVLSRWPIMESAKIDLRHPQQNGLVKRKVLWTKARSPRGDLGMASTHFSDGDDAAADRLDQAVDAQGFLASHKLGLPSFIAGDFNSTPESPPMQSMRVTMRDAWREVRPAENGFTEPASSPSSRIDYIYTAPGTKGSAVVKGCEVVLDQPVNGILASDHLGVLCWFELP